MKSSKKVVIIMIILAGLFGYSLYASATPIGVLIVDSPILSEYYGVTTQNLKLDFNNPSLLTLTSGDTEFVIYADHNRIVTVTLAAFVLPALGKSFVYGIFQSDSKNDS